MRRMRNVNVPELMDITKGTRHSKVIGEFGEAFVANWLSRSDFEVTIVDHTGLDIIAYPPAHTLRERRASSTNWDSPARSFGRISQSAKMRVIVMVCHRSKPCVIARAAFWPESCTKVRAIGSFLELGGRRTEPWPTWYPSVP